MDKLSIIKIAVLAVVAVLFFGGGYFVAKDRFKVVVSTYMDQQKQMIKDSIMTLKEENDNLIAKLNELPDIKVVTKTKYKTITKTLYEKVNTYEALPADQKLDAFATYLHKLPSYKSDTGYINSVQFK